jgi:hypothetical protein
MRLCILRVFRGRDHVVHSFLHIGLRSVLTWILDSQPHMTDDRDHRKQGYMYAMCHSRSALDLCSGGGCLEPSTSSTSTVRTKAELRNPKVGTLEHCGSGPDRNVEIA